MLKNKINRLKRETDFAERKLVENLNQIEGKVVLQNAFKSLIPATSSISTSISSLDNSASAQPLVQKGKMLLSIYKKFLILKKFYNLFKKA
jgi:hypothetical protein